MTDPAITYHHDLEQGSDEWLAARRGILTASEMHLALTPTLKVANNDKTRAHAFELAAQRVTDFTEPHFVSDDMLRGTEDEADALSIYMDKYEPTAKACGFVTCDFHGFLIGYSPDCIVGDDGLAEAKSRRQKFQMQVISQQIETGAPWIPPEHVLQCQTGLLVTGRQWLDYISYCSGMPMVTIRVYPDAEMHEAIVEASEAFEDRVRGIVKRYLDARQSLPRIVDTERKERLEIF